MKRLLTTLFGIILLTTTISSQPILKDTVVTITPIQLKKANLIFAEHEMLSKKVPLLESKISNLELVNSNWSTIDSLRSSQVTLYKNTLESKNQEVSNLQKSLKTSRILIGGSLLTSVILAIVCIFK